MRVLAARFRDRDAARGVLELLRDRLPLGVSDADIAPLAGAADPTRGEALLAGRFREARVPEVIRVIEDAGGEILADVPETWTKTPVPGSRLGPVGPAGAEQARDSGRPTQAGTRTSTS